MIELEDAELGIGFFDIPSRELTEEAIKEIKKGLQPRVEVLVEDVVDLRKVVFSLYIDLKIPKGREIKLTSDRPIRLYGSCLIDPGRGF